MDENLLEANSIFNKNNCINSNTNHQNSNTKKTNINYNNNAKLIEFIHDLKEAIQNGEFQSSNSNVKLQQQLQLHNHQQQNKLQEQIQQYEPINNVNNLSNQTFNYIINWLKQQQFQIDENKVNYFYF
jgi:hypothetical protein